jgi:DNA-binding CsgD family transcriptional regulator
MIHALSPREKLVARLIRKGMSNRDIAESMGVAVGTVKIHVHHILNKTNKRSRLELAVDRRLSPRRQSKWGHLRRHRHDAAPRPPSCRADPAQSRR